MSFSHAIPADAAVDLHLHTFASDGFWHPRTLMETVAAQGFRVVAICDHDSQKSVVEARDRAEDLGLIYVPGVEMTVTWNDRPWHLLVYGIAPDRDDAAAKPFLDLVAYQERRNAEVAVDARRRVEASGRPLPSAQAEINGPNHLPVHVLRSMIRERHSARLKEAADLVVELGGAFTTHVQLTDVVAAAHEAGGITILAHPGRPDLGPALDEETLVRMLAAAPIDGLETNYRTYTDFVTESLRDMPARTPEIDRVRLTRSRPAGRPPAVAGGVVSRFAGAAGHRRRAAQNRLATGNGPRRYGRAETRGGKNRLVTPWGRISFVETGERLRHEREMRPPWDGSNSAPSGIYRRW
jgi:predicted metal-dependent phosphoesterase TrpH